MSFAAISRSGEPRDYEVDGFPVTALAVNLKARHKELSVWHSLWRHLWARRSEIDLLHSHGAYYTQCIVGPMGRLLGKPSLVKASLANDDLHSLSEPRVAPFHRALLSMIDAYVAISDDLNSEWVRRGMNPSKVHQIPDGVDLTRFRPAAQDERTALARDLGLPADRPLALCLGVFDRRKRIAWLAEQWVAHKGFGSGVTLVAVGPTNREPYGPRLRRDLEALAAANPELLAVRDFTPEPERYCYASNLFVFPSANEGLPNAVLEAMACALPCVVARVSGSHELIVDGQTGATFPTDDAQGLGLAIAAVAGARGETLGAAARALVAERFDIERVADRYEALYAQLLRRR